MQQQSPTKSIIIKNECSSDNQNKFEAIITLKILANETGKEIWKDVCLTTERDTIGKMVKHVQEKFIPAEYLNKSLKLRNVTIFSERFGLEVSVAVDGLATDGAKYTANFLNSQNLTERAVDQSTTSNLQKKSEDQGKSLTDVEKKYKEKMDLFMKTERDLLKANKQKQTALDDLKLAEKNAKEKSEALKEAQNALDKVRDEKKRLQIDVAQLEKSKKDLGNYLKDMREMSAKKTKDLDKLNKDLEKLEKKRKGMLHQMDVYKKELDAELDGMNKLNTTREKTNSEIENLKNEKQKCKTSLESLKKSEEECRKNLEHLQEEEKKFYLMLNELKEHVHIHQTQLQELQGRENEKNLNENFGLVYGQNGNNNFGEVQQNFNEQSEFNCKGGQQQRGDGNEYKDTYFNENLWKRSASSFVQGKILGQRNVFNNGSESSSVDTFSPEVKRERKGETKKFTIEAQSPPTSSHFNQNSMQNRAVYIESEELGNPGDGELFSYVDNGPIFGHQNNLLSTACWQEQQPTTIIMTGPPQISPNSIQPLNSVLVNSVKDQPIYSFNSSSSSSGQFRRGTTNRICVVNANNNVRTCGKYRNRQLPILHAERNRSRKMRRGERDHKIFPKRFNISPIRGPIPSSSTSGTYGNCPHSVESSIMKRITIEDQPNKCSSSSIHSRLSFDRK